MHGSKKKQISIDPRGCGSSLFAIHQPQVASRIADEGLLKGERDIPAAPREGGQHWLAISGTKGGRSVWEGLTWTVRYDTSEKKYSNKRLIEFADIPVEPVEVRMGADQPKKYGWWPVAILDFKSAVYGERKFPDTASFVYVICIYQLVQDELFAWGIRTSNQKSMAAYKVDKDGPVETNLARSTFLNSHLHCLFFCRPPRSSPFLSCPRPSTRGEGSQPFQLYI